MGRGGHRAAAAVGQAAQGAQGRRRTHVHPLGLGGRGPGHRAGRLDHLELVAGIGAPHRAPAGFIQPFAQGLAGVRIVEQTGDFRAERLAVAEGGQPPQTAGQQFLGVPEGRGDDGFAQGGGVGQGAGRDLSRRQIGRHIDVRRLQIGHQLGRVGIGVDQAQPMADAQALRQGLQGLAVLLALAGDQMRVSSPQHQI